MDELSHLIVGAIERNGGDDVPKDKIIGLLLQHCKRDVFRAVQAHGGITRVLENTCHRYRERLEFITDDDGQDWVRLRQPFKQHAIDQYGNENMLTVSSHAPVRSEINLANDLWRIVRTNGEYREDSGEFEYNLSSLENYKGMTEANVYRFVSRPGFTPYFRVHMQSGPTGSVVKYLFAIGCEGPVKGLLGI
ncbi:hypothetical protein PMAYCL1PPCAC_21227 [Pristionchus mayeri]|uniref:Uncharacterized protein n=1 Tax=Pristionchus mayeri TaxID=1317129 RepID=A0AAN5CUU8_9BILA|nr:hypothetical protein PMAYCL1PPCAC_21227 [Pristionchus mayeri]